MSAGGGSESLQCSSNIWLSGNIRVGLD